MQRKCRPDGSIDAWGWPDAEGNPMVTLSDMMTSKSHISERPSDSVLIGRHWLIDENGSLYPSDDDIHARRRRHGGL